MSQSGIRRWIVRFAEWLMTSGREAKGATARFDRQRLEQDGGSEGNAESADLAGILPARFDPGERLIHHRPEIPRFPMTEGAVFPAALAVTTGIVGDAPVAGGDEALGHGEEILLHPAAAVEKKDGAPRDRRRSVHRQVETPGHATQFLRLARCGGSGREQGGEVDVAAGGDLKTLQIETVFGGQGEEFAVSRLQSAAVRGKKEGRADPEESAEGDEHHGPQDEGGAGAAAERSRGGHGTGYGRLQDFFHRPVGRPPT
jgi:hypothetical protein